MLFEGIILSPVWSKNKHLSQKFYYNTSRLRITLSLGCNLLYKYSLYYHSCGFDNRHIIHILLPGIQEALVCIQLYLILCPKRLYRLL